MNNYDVIIGMAKSCLNLKGAKNSKIELDLFKLIYTIQKLSLEGKSTVGYLLVASPNIKRVNKWISKYSFDNSNKCINIICDVLLDNDKSVLLEKSENATVFQIGYNKEKSLSKISKKLYEDFLSQKINEIHNVDSLNDTLYSGIKWDFLYINK